MAINIRTGKLLKRNIFKSLNGEQGSNVYTHTNETEVVVRIFGAEWGTGFEHSRKTHICEEIESNNQLQRKLVSVRNRRVYCNKDIYSGLK